MSETPVAMADVTSQDDSVTDGDETAVEAPVTRRKRKAVEE